MMELEGGNRKEKKEKKGPGEPGFFSVLPVLRSRGGIFRLRFSLSGSSAGLSVGGFHLELPNA